MLNDSLIHEFQSLSTGRWLTDFSNASAFLFQHLQPINWVGFYLVENNKLVLGPFQGKPACTDIEFSRGVCGAAFRDRKTVIVPDVHEFPGHIACDPDSRSEIVVPLLFEGKICGVLDVDSAQLARFSVVEQQFLEKFVAALMAKVGPVLDLSAFQKRSN